MSPNKKNLMPIRRCPLTGTTKTYAHLCGSVTVWGQPSSISPQIGTYNTGAQAEVTFC